MISRRRYTALLDANVLVPIRLTDLFVQLTVDDLFRARWTPKIHEEWMRNVRRIYPDLKQEHVARRRDQMDAETRDALIHGYELLMGSLTLPDQDDRHVLAAAIAGRCDVIVTYNLKDFPCDVLSLYGVEAQHPDVFLANHLDLFPGTFCMAIRKIRARHKKTKYTVDQYLDKLIELELVATVAGLREYAHVLD